MFNQDKCPSSPRLKAGASGPKSLVTRLDAPGQSYRRQ